MLGARFLTVSRTRDVSVSVIQASIRDMMFCMTRVAIYVLVAGLVGGYGSVSAQTQSATSRAAGLSDQELDVLYHSELGELYSPALRDRIHSAHELIERFFAAASFAERRELIRLIDATGIAPAILGRITRIRLDWAALEAQWVLAVDRTRGPFQIRYFLAIPAEYKRTVASPLVICLRVPEELTVSPPLADEQIDQAYRRLASRQLESHPGAAVLIPKLDTNLLYGPSTAGMNTVIQAMLDAADRVNIDPTRVMIIGRGIGAHAVWNLGLHYPTYFAAIVPFAAAATGDWQRQRMMNLRNVLPVVWHDAEDVSVKVENSRTLVGILRRFEVDVDYLETRGVGHEPSDAISQQADQKAHQRRRELYPRRVTLQSNRMESAFNRIDWVQLYQPLDPGGERAVFLPHCPVPLRINRRSASIDARISAANRVEVLCDNVESLRLYFNDSMIDFSKPLTIVVNRRTRFEGMIRPSIETLLLDQLFLGRGWRYFTAAVDIDLIEHKFPPPASTAVSSP